jgi:hypothetical protein
MENGKKAGQTVVTADKRIQKTQLDQIKADREKAVSEQKVIKK